MKPPNPERLVVQKGDAHDGALGGGVTPGLVVAGGKHTEVAASDKLLVAELQQRVV